MKHVYKSVDSLAYYLHDVKSLYAVSARFSYSSRKNFTSELMYLEVQITDPNDLSKVPKTWRNYPVKTVIKNRS